MFLSLRIAFVVPLLLLSAFSPIALAQADSMATCPDGTVSEAALTLPNGDACKLCSTIMDKCSASCNCPTADTCECLPNPPDCGTIVCPGDEPEEGCDACEAPDMPGTFYCVGDSFFIDEGSDSCLSCTCDDADGAIGCVSCSPPSVPCDACEAPDMPGTFYCVGDNFLVGEGSDSCASCTCDDADGAIGCVSCNPPSIEVEDESKQDECSVTVDVGCVMMDNEAIDCNDYVPNTPEGCSKQVKFTYSIDQQAPPLNIVLESIYRYRETSPFGSPRAYSEDKWGTDLTPFEMQYYKLNSWEGEYVDFCVPTLIETTLEYKTSCATTSDTYLLETTDVFPGQALPMSAEEPTPEDGEVNVDFFTGDDTTSAAMMASMPLFVVVSVAGIFGASVMTL